jgi:adenine-specific DNA-methyltransferase
MSIQKLEPSSNLDQERIEMLKQLFPEVVSDGKINWDVLKEVLGEQLEEDEAEHFGLNWAGKREARRLATIPSKGTLVPVPGEGIDEDTTENIFIEGDNLEVLKLLQKSYAGRIKLIYIDPPYNTGNDLIYKDDFSEPTEDYLRKTNQTDASGNLLTSNPKASGRYHSNWLNMMYPRLKLAKNLLRDDGWIFISIDDCEVSNLMMLMDEIFGSENSEVPFVWDLPRGINAGFISRSHEYILAYAKQKEQSNQFFILDGTRYSTERCNKSIDARHPASEIRFPAGIEYEGKDQVITGTIEGSERIVIKDHLVFKDGILAESATLEAGWTMKNMILKWLEGKEVFDSKGQKITRFFFKENGRLYSEKELKFQSVKSIIKGIADTQNGRAELQAIFDNQDVFSYPKPSKLIAFLAKLTTSNTDIMMDFFAGTCSSAQAIIDLNRQDQGKRKFIMVQINEPTDNEQFPSIAEIGKERIRRVIREIKKDQADKLDVNDGDSEDLGFRVYKLDRSNLKIWNDYKGQDVQKLTQLLIESQEPLVDGWTPEKVITEVQLLEGFPLDSKIEPANSFEQNRVYCVTAEDIEHRLFICLDNKLDISTVQEVRLLEDEDIFICLDAALTDQEKMMLADGCNIKTI